MSVLAFGLALVAGLAAATRPADAASFDRGRALLPALGILPDATLGALGDPIGSGPASPFAAFGAPLGLSSVTGFGAAATHREAVSELAWRDEVLGIVIPTGVGALGIGAWYGSYGAGLDARDSMANPLSGFGDSAAMFGAALGWGARFGRFAFGLSGTFAELNLPASKAEVAAGSAGIGVWLGSRYREQKGVWLSAAIANFSPIRKDASADGPNSGMTRDYEGPVRVALGIGWVRDSFRLSTEIGMRTGEDGVVNVGVEWWIARYFALRAGGRAFLALKDSSTDDIAATLGFGVRAGIFDLAYAGEVRDTEDFLSTHRATVGIQFGRGRAVPAAVSTATPRATPVPPAATKPSSAKPAPAETVPATSSPTTVPTSPPPTVAPSDSPTPPPTRVPATPVPPMAVPTQPPPTPSPPPTERPTVAPTSALQPTAVPAGSKPRFCTECGKPVPGSPKFCPECGANLGEGAAAAPPVAATKAAAPPPSATPQYETSARFAEAKAKREHPWVRTLEIRGDRLAIEAGAAYGELSLSDARREVQAVGAELNAIQQSYGKTQLTGAIVTDSEGTTTEVPFGAVRKRPKLPASPEIPSAALDASPARPMPRGNVRLVVKFQPPIDPDHFGNVLYVDGEAHPLPAGKPFPTGCVPVPGLDGQYRQYQGGYIAEAELEGLGPGLHKLRLKTRHAMVKDSDMNVELSGGARQETTFAVELSKWRRAESILGGAYGGCMLLAILFVVL